MPAVTVLIIAIIAVAAALALAWVPLQLLTSHIARNVRQFIARQREERRHSPRHTPDRRRMAP